MYSQDLARRARELSVTPGPATHELPRLAEEFARVEFALDALERNVSPTLAVEALLVELRR